MNQYQPYGGDGQNPMYQPPKKSNKTIIIVIVVIAVVIVLAVAAVVAYQYGSSLGEPLTILDGGSETDNSRTRDTSSAETSSRSGAMDPGTNYDKIVRINKYIEDGDNSTLSDYLDANMDSTNLNYYDAEIYAPLYEAIYWSNYEAIQILLDAGVNIDLADTSANFSSPLEFALYMEDQRAMQVLLDNGAETETRDSEGATPLMYSHTYGTAFVKILLDGGADVNATDFDLATPLMYAITNEDVVRLLIEYGADINMKDADGETAYDWAVYWADPGTVSQATLAMLAPNVAG